jgi:hypothetical protein
MAALNAGPALVNFAGHGSNQTWRGLLAVEDADGLTNGNRLPFVVAMDCLNGQFQNPFLPCLAEALLEAPGGGAIAVWASSGICDAEGQAPLNRALYQQLFGGAGAPFGTAAARAKAATTDLDVRRSWILFGDPTASLRR